MFCISKLREYERRANIINLIIYFLKYFIYYDYNNSYFNNNKFINP